MLRRHKPMCDSKRAVQGAKKGKIRKLRSCAGDTVKTVIYPEAASTWIQLSRTNWGEPHKSTLRKALRIMFFGVADAGNPGRRSGVRLGKLQISSTASRQRKKVSSPQTLTDAEFFHRGASDVSSGSDDAPAYSARCVTIWRPRPTHTHIARLMFIAGYSNTLLFSLFGFILPCYSHYEKTFFINYSL